MTDRPDEPEQGPDDIARLIANAGPRAAPAAQIEASVRTAVQQAWSEAVARRTARWRTRRLAVAASLVAVTAASLWFGVYHRSAVAPADATLLAVRGDVTVAAAHERQLIAAGSRLPLGTTLHTAKSGFVLMTVAGESVRVGPDSRVRVGSGGHLSLTNGRVYVETGAAEHKGAPLVVSTPFGRVAHLGTQFQVVVDPADLAVSVRSGHVRVTDASGRVQRLTAGEGVQVLRGGAVRRMAVRTYGPDWAWAEALVPDLPIDGRPLSAFLAWYAREMGLKLVLLGQGTAAAVRHTVLSGSIAGMTPDQALVAVMATTHFEYDRKVPGELRIRMPHPAD